MGIRKLDFDAAVLGDGKISVCLRADQVQELADLLRKEAIRWVDLNNKKIVKGKITAVTTIVGVTVENDD